MTDKAKKTSEKDELEQCYIKIEYASQQLLGLVNDILDITSFDTGNFDFYSKSFSFSKALHFVIDSISQKAALKDQVFVTTIDNRIPDWVQSDERRLRQVLINLLDNAVKFTPEKGRIELSAKMTENNGKECTVHFEIVDSGIGITQEALEHIGEIFEQADNSITRGYGGMGVGLSINKRIVTMMNGYLKVESEPGKGSCFICVVRLGIAEEPAPERTLNDQEENRDVDLNGKRILVVDDVEINIEILYAIFEDSGAVLERAANGEKAVDLFLQNKYDLILMDLHMPVMDGFTATKKMRDSALPWAKSIPVIAISAESGGDLHKKCLEAGINDHLPKPIDAKALFKMIAKWMPK